MIVVGFLLGLSEMSGDGDGVLNMRLTLTKRIFLLSKLKEFPILFIYSYKKGFHFPTFFC
jgi:hypothetical protein